jgi:hypothetical protein
MSSKQLEHIRSLVTASAKRGRPRINDKKMVAGILQVPIAGPTWHTITNQISLSDNSHNIPAPTGKGLTGSPITA